MPSENKESVPFSLKKVGNGRLLIRVNHVQEASREDAAKIEQALDRLLSELVRQEQARERMSS